MALVSTPVSCRKAFVRVDSAASKENSPKMGIFSINLNSEAFSSEGRNKIQGREPPSPPLEKGDYAIWLMTLYGPKALGGMIWTRKILVHKPHNTIKTQKHFFFHLKKDLEYIKQGNIYSFFSSSGMGSVGGSSTVALLLSEPVLLSLVPSSAILSTPSCPLSLSSGVDVPSSPFC